MPSNVNESTAKISMDISDLKAGISEANRLIKLANSEFKAASSGMDDWGSSADGLSAKIQQLTKVQDAEQKKLELLQQQYKLVAAEQGETSAAAQNLQIRINNQQATLNKTTAELNKYQQELDDVSSAAGETAGAVDNQRSAYEKLQSTIDDQQATLNKLKGEYTNVALEQGESSDAAQDLAREIQDLSSELSDNQKRLKDAESAADSFDSSLDDMGDSAGEAEGGFTILKGALANFAGNILTSAVGGIKDFVGSLFDLSEATEEYRSMMAKTQGSADAFGYSIEFANSKYQEFYKYLGDDQMSTNAITNLMGMKVSTDTVSDAANAAIAVWSAYGDSIPIEGLTESINESAQVAQVTGSLADAINWAARSNEDWSAAMEGHSSAQAAFNAAIKDGESAEDAYSAALAACADTQERADLIAQTLNKTYGTSKTTYDELNGSILDANAAELDFKDTQAELGAAMEPVNTAITNLKDRALGAIAPVVENVAGHFANFLNWLLETPGAMGAVTSVVAGLATAFGILAAALAIQALINGVQKAFALLNITMLANPFVLIAALIAGVVVALVSLYNSNETFRNGVQAVWSAIVSFLSGVIDGIVNFFTVTIPNAIQNMTDWFSQLPGNISNFIGQVWSSITEWVANMVDKALELGQTFLQNVVNFFQQLPERIGYFIGYALGSVVKWALDMAAKAKETGTNFLNNIVSFFTQLPGKVQSFIANAYNNVVNWAKNMIAKAKETGQNFLNNVINFIKNLPGNLKNLITTAYNNVVSWGSNMISKAKETGSNFVNNVVNFVKNLPGNIKNQLATALNNVIKWGSDMVSRGKSAATNLVNTITNTIKGIPSKMLSIGKDIVNGIWNGISGAAGWLKKKISGFVDGIVSGFKSALKIGSPSRVFADESRWIPAGIAEGVEGAEDEAIAPIQALTKKMRNALSGATKTLIPDEIKTSLSTLTSGIKTNLRSAAATTAGVVQETRDIIFNQYNNSPKALSRLDIYRQTKSQLFAAKGRLANV